MLNKSFDIGYLISIYPFYFFITLFWWIVNSAINRDFCLWFHYKRTGQNIYKSFNKYLEKRKRLIKSAKMECFQRASLIVHPPYVLRRLLISAAALASQRNVTISGICNWTHRGTFPPNKHLKVFASSIYYLWTYDLFQIKNKNTSFLIELLQTTALFLSVLWIYFHYELFY